MVSVISINAVVGLTAFLKVTDMMNLEFLFHGLGDYYE